MASKMGGPLEMTLGWPLATVFTLVVAASMAELCSAYPTAGATYDWAADLGGKSWGWLVAWLNIPGLFAAGRHQPQLRAVHPAESGHPEPVRHPPGGDLFGSSAEFVGELAETRTSRGGAENSKEGGGFL
jgi:hypothetical protein